MNGTDTCYPTGTLRIPPLHGLVSLPPLSAFSYAPVLAVFRFLSKALLWIKSLGCTSIVAFLSFWEKKVCLTIVSCPIGEGLGVANGRG